MMTLRSASRFGEQKGYSTRDRTLLFPEAPLPKPRRLTVATVS